MKSMLLVNKPAGLTPLQYIEVVRKSNPHLQEEKISMAGRLDPMAEGLLLLLVGDENKNRSSYENMNKEYTFSVIFGIQTDSYDGLGMIDKITTPPSIEVLEKTLSKIIPSYKGTYSQTYPPFSSKPYKGKPLYYWSRKEKISKDDLPKKDVTLFSLQVVSLKNIPLTEIADSIINRIESIHGEFRQDEILLQWKKLKSESNKKNFSLVTFHLSCSSGTYVRSLANELGEKTGVGAFTYTITRTRIGNYTLDDI